MSNASFRLESFRPWNPFQDKDQPLRDSLDICRYPSPVSMTASPPFSNPIDPVLKSQKGHSYRPGQHPLPARPPLEVCLDGGLHTDAQKTRHDPEDLGRTTSNQSKKQLGDDTIERLANDFASKVPDEVFSPAEVLSFLLEQKNSPFGAVAGVETWVAKANEAASN